MVTKVFLSLVVSRSNLTKMTLPFEGHFRYCERFHCLYLKTSACNVASQLQWSDVIREQLFLLRHSTGRSVRGCWARPVNDS